MKKSLVALAVLAASGAVLAQVKVSGNLTAGFQNSVTQGNASSGFGVDTAEITFSATEDLGGGMKAGASMGLVGMARGRVAPEVLANQSVNNATWATGFGAANTSLYVSGDFGRVTLATARGTDYLTGGVAFVGGTYQDGRALSNRDASDSIAWSMPVGPVAVSLTYSEPNNYLGLGQGTSGAYSGNTTPAPTAVANNSQSSIALGLRYTDGPLVGDFGYTTYDEGDTVPNNVNGVGLNNGDKTNTRFAGSYDFGAFKLGGGWTQRSAKVGTRTDMGVSAAVPLGALTLGANWVQRDVKEFRDNDATPNTYLNIGYGFSANYAMSKRTSLIADYTAFTGINGNNQNNGREMNTVYSLLLSHSF